MLRERTAAVVDVVHAHAPPVQLPRAPARLYQHCNESSSPDVDLDVDDEAAAMLAMCGDDWDPDLDDEDNLDQEESIDEANSSTYGVSSGSGSSGARQPRNWCVTFSEHEQ